MVDFPLPTAPGDEDEAVVILREQLEHLGQAKLVHRAEIRRDDAEDQIEAEALAHDAGAEAAEIVLIGKIDVSDIGEVMLLGRGEESHGEPLGILGGEGIRVVPDRLEHTVTAPHGRRVHAEVDIGGVMLLADGKIHIDVCQ